MEGLVLLLLIFFIAAHSRNVGGLKFHCAENPKSVIARATKTYRQGNFRSCYSDELSPKTPPGDKKSPQSFFRGLMDRFERKYLNEYLCVYHYKKSEAHEFYIGERMSCITEMGSSWASNEAILARFFLDKNLRSKGREYHAIYFDEGNNLVGEVFQSVGSYKRVQKYLIDPAIQEEVSGPFIEIAYLKTDRKIVTIANEKLYPQDRQDEWTIVGDDLRKISSDNYAKLAYDKRLRVIVGTDSCGRKTMIDPITLSSISGV